MIQCDVQEVIQEIQEIVGRVLTSRVDKPIMWVWTREPHGEQPADGLHERDSKMTHTTNAPERAINGTSCTVEIRNGWHVVRDRSGDVIGKRYDMEHAVKLAVSHQDAR